jgi:hypothetical protein
MSANRFRGTAQQRVNLNPLDFYLWGHLKSPVYTAPFEDEIFHEHIFDACQTLRNRPGTFEMLWKSRSDVVHACIA